MKKFFMCLIVALAFVAGAVAQEEQSLIKINVLDSDATPKIYVAKAPNFMGNKLLCEGSGEGYVDSSFHYIGFDYFSLQPLKLDSNVIEFNVEPGNKTLSTVGIVSAIAGVICIGAGGGILGSAYIIDGSEGLKQTLPAGIGLAGAGVAGLTVGLVLNGLNKPKLIRVNN